MPCKENCSVSRQRTRYNHLTFIQDSNIVLLCLSLDLEAAAKCLQFVANRATIEKELRNWDKGGLHALLQIVDNQFSISAGFQSMLASSQKQGTGKKPSKTVEILCSEVLAPLQRGLSMTTNTDFHTLTTPQPNRENIDCLTTCSAILAPLTISIHAASNTLICSMEHSLASSSLPGLARYTFSEGRRVYRGVCEVQQELDIRRSLPSLTRCKLEYSRVFVEGKRIEGNYSSLQATVNYMCVSNYTLYQVKSKGIKVSLL